MKRKEKMANNALRRCHNKAISHAWKCWNGQHLKLVRLKQLSMRIVTRWKSKEKAAAWVTGVQCMQKLRTMS